MKSCDKFAQTTHVSLISVQEFLGHGDGRTLAISITNLAVGLWYKS